jgi:drug/metabolite transporter (DMT)-like permease
MLKGFSFSDQHFRGIIAGILSGLTYAMLIIIGRFLAQRFSPLIITVFQNLVVVTILLPFIKDIPFEIGGYFLLLGLIHSTAAPLLYVRGLREVKASKAAVLGYLEPVSAMVLAMIVLREFPGIGSLLGGALIILSGYLIIKRREKSVHNNILLNT